MRVEKLLEVIGRFSAARVLVVGDVMLDEYVWGEARRISPEAPVPVVEVERRTFAPGGAANAAANARGLSARVTLGGVVGEDEQAGLLRAELERRGIEHAGLIAEASRPTTTKVRLVAQQQQVARYDVERRDPIGGEVRARLRAWVAAQLPACNACLISDYGKGVASTELVQETIALAARGGTPVVVDPKGADYGRYHGATLVTPNIHETERATGREIANHEDLVTAATELQGLVGGAVLITRGARGMSLFAENPGQAIEIPAQARAVFDVTGAGDTVAATLAVALAAGASLEEAALLANVAASVVVGQVGTAAITADGLRAELQSLERLRSSHSAP